MPKPRRRDEVARLEAELSAARPFLELAREISDDVARVVDDPGAPPEALEEAIRAIPERERAEVVRAVFDRLTPDRQWAVIEHAFGDEEIRAALEDERAVRLDEVRRTEARRRLARHARVDQLLDVDGVPVGELLVLGLFREPDVAAAAGRGARSSAAARRLVLRRVEGSGNFAVVEDVFNPEGGYFVDVTYDRDAWALDRLSPHAVVRPGSLVDSPAGRRFEPVLHVRGRVDVERDSEVRQGRLHLGYAMVGDEDVFHERSRT
ncbi:MAG: hypothetical protein K0R11_984 [Acidimicrobiales bacterium]|nr:hypothetical protein [Acidimicrobiales bacterium]